MQFTIPISDVVYSVAYDMVYYVSYDVIYYVRIFNRVSKNAATKNWFFKSKIVEWPLKAMWMCTLAEISDWNSFRVNQNYSDSLWYYLYPSRCESFRINPKNVLYLVWWKTIKNQSDLIRLIPRNQSEWIRTNPKPSFQSRSIRNNPSSDWSKPNFQSESIRINPRSEWFGLIGLIWIENLVWNWFGFIRIDVSELIGLSWIDFW